MKNGDRLLSVFGRAQFSIRIAAPFIKLHSLQRALAGVAEGVTVTCVTRWKPEDIASGMCDPEIFDVLKRRQDAKLFIHSQLHAKFFAADETCLVGSANLTNTAFGWRTPSNFELLVELNSSESGLDHWWNDLLDGCVLATEDMRSALVKQAEVIQASGTQRYRPEADPDNIEEWLPECPRWTGLWEAYVGDDDRLPTSALQSARSDLAVLNLPLGMSKDSFEIALKGVMRQTRIFQEIEQIARVGLTDLSAYNLLVEQFNVASKDAPRRWQHIKRWLSELYPDEFHLEANEEVLWKGKNF